MRCAILGFAAGAAWLQMQAALPQPLTLLACGAIALLLCGLRGCMHAALAGTLIGLQIDNIPFREIIFYIG